MVWFSKGGATAIGNLVLVCRRHHHRLHQPGWQAKPRPGASFEVSGPNGAVRITHPPGTGPPATWRT